MNEETKKQEKRRKNRLRKQWTQRKMRIKINQNCVETYEMIKSTKNKLHEDIILRKY